jgi:hypothetical protein
MLWVTAKRARLREGQKWWTERLLAADTFVAVLLSYSSILRGGARARAARSFGWHDVLHASQAFNERWEELRTVVVRFFYGLEPDPCPAALHWGSRRARHDVARAKRALDDGRWVVASCAVQTANAFYAVAALRPPTEVLR